MCDQQASFPPPLAPNRIIYFSNNCQPFFSDEGLVALLPRITERATVQLARNWEDLIYGITRVPPPLAVFVNDEKLRDGSLVAAWNILVNNARAGSLLVVIGQHPYSMKPYPRGVYDLWTLAGLPWRLGPPREESVALNYQARECPNFAFENLPLYYKPNAVFLQNVPREDAWYLLQEEIDKEPPASNSMVETPVAFARVGRGTIAYVGDMGVE